LQCFIKNVFEKNPPNLI